MDNADQKEFWTDGAGPAWLRHQTALDQLMQPVLDGVLRRADLKSGEVVIDVGCGTGGSTVQAAKRVGPTGHVLGVDISATMLARAEERGKDLGNVSFACADATTHEFDRECFTHLISRFGVMFFADPVASFTNMAKALEPEARVTFASWGQIAANPFFTEPAQVARGILGAPPKTDPDLPGPFAFREPDRVIDILTRAGFAEADCEVQTLHLTPDGDRTSFAELLCNIGPAQAAARHFDATPDQNRALQEGLAKAFARFQTDKGLRIPAEINFFTAIRP